MMRRAWIRELLLCAIAALGPACNQGLGPGDDADAGVSAPDLAPAIYADFPLGPVLDPGGGTPAPGNAAELFGPPGSGMATGGPCLLDPEVGALFPNNWLPLRVQLQPQPGQNLFEIRLRAANQLNDLLVYTRATTWAMPAGMWQSLLLHDQDVPITISVRGAPFDGQKLTAPPALGTSGDFTIAPVSAAGTIVYWTTSGGTALRGFRIGDTGVRDVLRPAQSGARCIGCHTSTPDGLAVGLSASSEPGNGDPSHAALRSVDGQAAEPSYLSAAARTLLGRSPQQLPAFSGAHYRAGDRTLFSMLPVNNGWEIIWTDLEAASDAQGQGWGILARTGDARMAASANPSHDGQRVLYVSASQVGAGVTNSDGDLLTIPYGNRQGGQATPVPGASDPAFNEFYPVYSPDDQLIAFDRVAAGQSSYNNPAAEVFVVSAQGGPPARLAANDPPACSGKKSPGVTNSWPKWSPERTRLLRQEQVRTYYWITFSSTRGPGGNPQLYVAGVVVDGAAITSHRAIYLWNQPPAENNHTPAWDVFHIPIE